MELHRVVGSMTASERARELVAVASAAADAKQALDPVALDVSTNLALTDAFLIVSGRNERSVIAIGEEIEHRLRELDAPALRREGATEGRWMLLDFGDLIVHVFHEQDRLYYQLERLWADCPVIPLDVSAASA